MRYVFIAAAVAVSFLGCHRKGADTVDAKNIVLDTVETPSTTKIVSATVLAKASDWRLVQVVADVPNRLGVPLRKIFCVTYTVGQKDVHWSRETGVQECSRQPSEAEIRAFEEANEWPTAIGSGGQK